MPGEAACASPPFISRAAMPLRQRASSILLQPCNAACPRSWSLYYSRGGSVARLARHVARGVGEVEGMSARMRTVPPVAR